ncbi:hypothetical protein SteCoe_24331 [Stentor coeruleus]|uniref:Uncharacterized protein n=1 Tax=Stentor coeruleus TaxID=5963 RepID=A0A1R2BHQ8_9CILI|nr:hypothetical protein SteCoe_24331 [Stentor coeruleus]
MDKNSENVIDFWEEIEPSEPKLTPQKTLIHYKSIKKESTNDPIEIERLKETMKELRKIGKYEARLTANQERKETRELIQEAVIEIQKKFEFEVYLAQIENERMQRELATQLKNISYITNYLVDSEVKIAQHRLFKLIKQPTLENPEKVQSNIKSLHKEIGLIRLKIEALKEAIKSYRSTTENTNGKVEELMKILSTAQITNEKEAKNFEIDSNNRIVQGKIANVKFKQEFENYKTNKLKELEVAEAKCKNNTAFIEALQNELKSAKEILFHPVLKLRIYDRLQDYIDEYRGNTKSRLYTHRSLNPYSSRCQIGESKPTTGMSPNVRENNTDMSPFVSKLNLYSRKTTSRETRAPASKSILFFNNSSGFVGPYS